MATYTGSDKRLAYLFEHGGGGGGSANIWTGTMAEYIAQASQIADDTAVFITDDEIQSLIVSSYDIYSEDEKEVGVFLDGKPLYQRTIDCGNAPDNTTKQIQHGIANIDKIVNVKGMGWSSANNTYYPIPFVQRSNVIYQIQMTAGRTAIDIATGSNLFTAVNIYATIQYTKTTDTAGSGLFVPSGAGAVHYSTSEQVVGTWIDGSTLYKKTLETVADVSLNNSAWNLIQWDSEPANLSYLVSAELHGVVPNINEQIRFIAMDGHIKGASLSTVNYRKNNRVTFTYIKTS